MELTELETVENVPVVRVTGDIDLATCDELRATLDEVLSRGTRLVVVDISRVEFLDSSGLKVLDDALSTARANGGEVALVCPQERLRRLFDITGLADRFAIGTTTENAVTAAPGRRRNDG